MKRFGLRALASTLATLMVVSAFAPAKAASAADVLLIAPNPNALKTLYITEDMVDEDGEIVISGGSYDRVVVAKEVAAKDIYFDQVTVGEMVVESGGESRIQLWEVDAEQVTVQEPELEALSLLDIKDLLKDEETRAVALQMYKESKEKDAKTKKTAPKIVTKEDAQVETLVARANVTLDLADGEVNEVALEGSEKVDRAKVTLKNYNGDVSFKGTEGKSNMTLNNVDSRIKTLKVEESNANNYFAVNARNSVVLKAEVAGNARLALNALTGTLEVTEEADAANITLLNTIEEMNIAGDNAKVEVATCGRVEMATITGDKANVGGEGVLTAVEITGEGAYVSTFGTDVEGENTYIPPVYVPPEVPKVVVKDIDMVAGDGTTVKKNADGSSTISFNGQYKAASFIVPDTVDVDRLSSVVLNITTSSQFGMSLVANGYGQFKADYPGWGMTGETTADYTISVGDPSIYKVAKVKVQSQNSGQPDLTINSITFIMMDEAPTRTPSAKPTANFSYVFDASTEPQGYGFNKSVAEGGVKLTLNGGYAKASYWMPNLIDLKHYSKMIVKVKTLNNSKVTIDAVPLDATLDGYDNLTTFWTSGKTAYPEVTEIEVPLQDFADDAMTMITFKTDSDIAEVILYSVTFVVGDGSQNPPAGGDTTTPTDPEISEEEYTVSEDFTTNIGAFRGRGDAIATVTDGAMYVSNRTANWHGAEISLDTEKIIGRTLNVSFKAKWDAVAPGQLKATLNTKGEPNGVYVNITTTDMATGGEWTKVTGTVAVPLEAEIATLYFEATDVASFYIDDVVISTEEITTETPDDGDDDQGGNESTAPADGTPCAPDGANVVHSFDTEDLRDYAGDTVTISVSVCKRGDAEAAVHLQTGAPYYAGVAGNDSWTRPITEEWTTYTCEFPVPADWENAENPINFGLRMCRDDNGAGPLLYDYDACKFYYKDFSIVKKEVEAMKEFYFVNEGNLMKDLAFSLTAGEDGTAVLLGGFSLDSEWHWSQKMPQEAQSVIAPSNFATMAGALENIKAIEYSVTLTNATPVSTEKDGEFWAPQLIAILQGNGDNGTWENTSYCQNYVNGGKATVEAPKLIKTTLYLDSKTFDETGESVAWTDAAIGQLAMKFQCAEPGTKIEGTYSIKVILN